MSEYVSDSRLSARVKGRTSGVTSEWAARAVHDPEETKKGMLIKDCVDAVNVTDNQTAMTRMSSLAACVQFKTAGIEPVLRVMGDKRQKNRVALQAIFWGLPRLIFPTCCVCQAIRSFGTVPRARMCMTGPMQLVQTVRYMRDEGNKFLGGDDGQAPAW